MVNRIVFPEVNIWSRFQVRVTHNIFIRSKGKTDYEDKMRDWIRLVSMRDARVNSVEFRNKYENGISYSTGTNCFLVIPAKSRSRAGRRSLLGGIAEEIKRREIKMLYRGS